MVVFFFQNSKCKLKCYSKTQRIDFFELDFMQSIKHFQALHYLFSIIKIEIKTILKTYFFKDQNSVLQICLREMFSNAFVEL